MPLDIDWEGLVVAFENRSQRITHFFDRATGDVVQVLAERDAAKHAESQQSSRQVHYFYDEDDNFVATVMMDQYYATLAEKWFGLDANAVLTTKTNAIDGIVND